MNRVILLGHVFTDLYVKQLENKPKCALFVLLTEEKWVDAKGTQKEIANWHKIVLFKPKLIDWCEQQLKKGAKIIVEGKLYNRRQKNKDGQNYYTSEVVIDYSYGHITNLSPLPVHQEDGVEGEDKIALQQASAQHPSSEHFYQLLEERH